MKREEKNLRSRAKILERAQREFAEKGYGMGSINAICGEGEISKGILYHYFEDKDAIYLSCVQACFDGLTAALRDLTAEGGAEEALNRYFSARLKYFVAHPLDQRIFCEAVIAPPEALRERIEAIRAPFDRLNIGILNDILHHEPLNAEYGRDEVIELFREYQDFVNARFRSAGGNPVDARAREQSCQRALRVMLYGVIAREGAPKL